jgi:hypothetical protein
MRVTHCCLGHQYVCLPGHTVVSSLGHCFIALQSLLLARSCTCCKAQLHARLQGGGCCPEACCCPVRRSTQPDCSSGVQEAVASQHQTCHPEAYPTSTPSPELLLVLLLMFVVVLLLAVETTCHPLLSRCSRACYTLMLVCPRQVLFRSWGMQTTCAPGIHRFNRRGPLEVRRLNRRWITTLINPLNAVTTCMRNLIADCYSIRKCAMSIL